MDMRSQGRDSSVPSDAASELEAATARFDALVEQSISGIYVIQDGRFAYVNRRMAGIFGYAAPGEVVGRRVEELVAPEDRATVAENLAERLAGRVKSLAYSFRGLRQDGRSFDVGVHGTLASYEGRAAIVGTLQDISEKKREEDARIERLKRAHCQLDAIGAVSRSEALVAADVRQLAREITEAAAQVAGVERANVWLFNDAETELRCIDCYEATPRRHSEGALLTEAEFANEFRALKGARFVDAHEPLTDPRTAGYVESYLKPLGISAMLDAVIQVSGRHLGLLCLEHVGRPHRWEQDEIAFACQLADKIALAMLLGERRDAQAALRQGLEDTILAIAATAEMRDPYTAGHERRVAELAAAIAREMGLAASAVEGLRFGAIIHDLGKIKIPAEILVKPTRLTPIEYELIKGHALAGYDILKGISFPWPVAQMVRQHHERIDGSGYPDGLKDGAIIAEARILAVADTVEAMSSHRPYRPGLGIDKALAEIERGRGAQYDVQTVDACLRLFRENGYTLPA
jgi:PAS domain S-box-containing protein/putative nucleotidyltransferase with HDIG domain